MFFFFFLFLCGTALQVLARSSQSNSQNTWIRHTYRDVPERDFRRLETRLLHPKMTLSPQAKRNSTDTHDRTTRTRPYRRLHVIADVGDLPVD